MLMQNEELLKKYNMKITKARLTILQIFRQSTNSISAEEIYDLCKSNQEGINLSTVYRTLDLFVTKEIISKFNLGQGKDVYKLKKESHRHVLECSVCNEEIEIPCPMVQIEESLQNEMGFTLTEHSLKLKGVCSKCNNN